MLDVWGVLVEEIGGADVDDGSGGMIHSVVAVVLVFDSVVVGEGGWDVVPGVV